MLAHLLAIAIAGGSLSFYLALLFVPRIYRHPTDFGWSGLGLFYALVLWVCAGRLTGGVLLGQTASVALLIWLGWQTALLRRATDAVPPELPQALLNSPLGPLIQRFRSSAMSPVEAPSGADTPTHENEVTQTVDQTSGAETSTADEPATVSDASEAVTEPTGSSDTPESLTDAPAEEKNETQSPATDATISVTEDLDTAHLDGGTAQDVAVSQSEPASPISESRPSPAKVTTPVEVLPPVPSQDFSDVPEPAVITGLQDLEDLATLEPDSPEEEALESTADIDPLADELWGDAKAPSIKKKPEPSPQQSSAPVEQPKADTAPKTPPSETIEAEVSTSFADRIVEANFNPEEEDIVDVDVISSSPPQDKE
ncbi:MAG: hypothetical protein F6J87_03255 [Spirulina sp. SIO3F2]|nr:hypothetical protein [Spirulina sp. SIO3F2]